MMQYRLRKTDHFLMPMMSGFRNRICANKSCGPWVTGVPVRIIRYHVDHPILVAFLVRLDDGFLIRLDSSNAVIALLPATYSIRRAKLFPCLRASIATTNTTRVSGLVRRVRVDPASDTLTAFVIWGAHRPNSPGPTLRMP